MKLINNVTETLKDDLSVEIHEGSKLSIAAACFSIYAFQELKKQLTSIDAFSSNDKKATPIQQLSIEYNFESCEEIEACQLVTVIAEFSAIYGNKNKNIDKSYGSPGGYDGEVIETMEDLFLLALFEIYVNLLINKL